MGWLYPSFVDLGMDCGVDKYGCGGHHLPVYSSPRFQSFITVLLPMYIFFFFSFSPL
jgi:hypothetical protein